MRRHRNEERKESNSKNRNGMTRDDVERCIHVDGDFEENRDEERNGRNTRKGKNKTRDYFKR